MIDTTRTALFVSVAHGAGSGDDDNPTPGNLPAKFLADPVAWAEGIAQEWGGKVPDIQLWNPFGVWIADENDAGETVWSMHFDATDYCRVREPKTFEQIPRALDVLRGAFERVDCYLGELSIHVNTNPMRVWVNNRDPSLVTHIPQGKGWHGEPSPHVREGDPALYFGWFGRQVDPVIDCGCGVFTGTSRGLPGLSHRCVSLFRLQLIGVRVGIEPVSRSDVPHMRDFETWTRQRNVERHENKPGGWDLLPLSSLTARRCIGMLDSSWSTLEAEVKERHDAGWHVALRPADLRRLLA